MNLRLHTLTTDSIECWIFIHAIMKQNYYIGLQSWVYIEGKQAICWPRLNRLSVIILLSFLSDVWKLQDDSHLFAAKVANTLGPDLSQQPLAPRNWYFNLKYAMTGSSSFFVFVGLKPLGEVGQHLRGSTNPFCSLTYLVALIVWTNLGIILFALYFGNLLEKLLTWVRQILLLGTGCVWLMSIITG